jgi:Ca-activated chloride channel family protein
VTVLSERPDTGEDGYFLAVIHGAPDETLVPEAKNVVFVIDRSGSMQGEKIVQAREALAFMVSKLRAEDRFNIVSYSSDVKLFAERLQAPSGATLAAAQGFVEAIAAEGGTNISQALSAALAQFDDTSLLNQVVFLTDGLPTEGETETSRLCALVHGANRHQARLVAFGLGFDVNGMLLDRLAEEHHGMSEYVLPDQPIEERVPGFYARMQAPLLLDAGIAFEGTEVHDLFPRAVGDLYGGHKLVLTGRYSRPGPAKLVLSGRRGLEAERHEVAIDLAADTRDSARDVVARIWAAKQIGYLVDEIRLDGETPERVAAIVRLGTRFGILTEYTAFLADEATDLYAFGANNEACSNEIKKWAGMAVGVHGVAQACNSKVLQRGDQAIGCNTWVGADGQSVTITNVQCISGRAFFKKGDTWRQSDLPTDAAVVELALDSDEFFALLEQHPWLGPCVARTGDVTVVIAGKNVRVKG